MIAAVPHRRAPAWSWWVVLAVVVHLVGCAHGPLSSDTGRVDALAVLGAGASPPSAGAAHVATGDGSCEQHHGGMQACVGVDEPAVTQAEPGTVPLPPPAAQGGGADERPGAVRGPPSAAAGVPGPGRVRAALQVWRN